MKAILKISSSILIITLIGVSSLLAQTNKINNIREGRYLVIGTFHLKRNAVGFTGYVKKMNIFNVTLAYHPPQKYYYVYIKSYKPGEDGLRAVDLMRKETEFIDTWLMKVDPYSSASRNNTSANAKKDEEPDNWVRIGKSSPSESNPALNDNKGMTIAAGSSTVIDENGKIIGMVGTNNQVLNFDGHSIGRVAIDGNVVAEDGRVIGSISNDNKVIGASGKIIGTIRADGKVVSPDGENDKIIGSVGKDGIIRDEDGQLMGTVGAYGKVRDSDGNIIGAVGSYRQAIGSNGAVIGTVGANGKVINDEGKAVGVMAADGKVRNDSGSVIGAVGAFGQVVDLNGYVIGVVGTNGQAIGTDGDIIGKVGKNGKIRNENGEVIGTVGEYGQIIDFDGKVIGKAGENSQAIGNNGEIIGTVKEHGNVIGLDGKAIGTVGIYGQVIGENGDIIGTVTSFGQVAGAGGQVIGRIGSGLTPELVRAELANTSSINKGIPKAKLVPQGYVEKGKYKLYFNTYYEKNFKEVQGYVDIVNPKSLRLLRAANSHQLIRIADPNNGEHSVQLIANIFGYKKVQHDIKLDEPFDEVNEEFFHFKGDTLVADFPLRRYDQGDIATMYNVFFFKDAAIMKSNSKFEVNSLVEMLKENDELKIKIHGHTNSNERGKIITIVEGSTQFFTLNQELVEKYGTAKELSAQRAQVISDYLISFGIDATRMEVIGWGGKNPIYDKMDKLAVKNVRVEIEIMEN
jgi:outer membrane protein OmpA-like peptidoglycan-associated protein